MSTMLLSMVPEGDEVVIVSFRGGSRFVQKLAAMGFVPGAKVKVVKSQNMGPLIVSIKGSRMAIGRGIATKIEVR